MRGPALAALPGIGPWTVEMVAMRGLGDPDAFPATDLGVRRGWLGRRSTLPPAVASCAPGLAARGAPTPSSTCGPPVTTRSTTCPPPTRPRRLSTRPDQTPSPRHGRLRGATGDRSSRRHIVLHDTPVGPLTLVATGDCPRRRLDGGPAPPPRHRRPRRPGDPPATRSSPGSPTSSRSTSRAERTEFDLPLAPAGTPSSAGCGPSSQRIPFGETQSYGQLAQQLGSPAARAPSAWPTGATRSASSSRATGWSGRRAASPATAAAWSASACCSTSRAGWPATTSSRRRQRQGACNAGRRLTVTDQRHEPVEPALPDVSGPPAWSARAAAPPDRDDHGPAGPELVEQLRRQVVGSAETRIRSKGPRSGAPSTPRRARTTRAHGIPAAATLAVPSSTRAGTRSTPTHRSRWAPQASARRAVVQPDPDPTSRTRSPSCTSSSSSMVWTVLGWEFVWPWPMGSGASTPAKNRCPLGRNRTRGTSVIALCTRSAALTLPVCRRPVHGFGLWQARRYPWAHVWRVRLPCPRAAARAGQQAHPVRRR